MSRSWVACALLSLAMVPTSAFAQAEARMSTLEIALACAPPPRLTPVAATGPRIAGAQDTMPRTVFGGTDRLVISAGTSNGIALGQRYFIRREPAAQSKYVMAGHVTQTVGWLHIVAVGEATAIAAIDHSCTTITIGDFLEPFAAPAVPSTLTAVTKLGELDFSAPARVLFGDQERASAAVGEFVLVDRGANSGAAHGSRFAIYRDLRQPNVPLASIGEAVVVSESADVAVLRIVRARDAVFSGDYLVPEKK